MFSLLSLDGVIMFKIIESLISTSSFSILGKEMVIFSIITIIIGLILIKPINFWIKKSSTKSLTSDTICGTFSPGDDEGPPEITLPDDPIGAEGG